MVKTLSMLIHAQPVTVWSVLLDSIEDPQRYMPDVDGSSVVERLVGGTAKELKIGWECLVPDGFDYFVFDQGALREIKAQKNGNDYEPGLLRSFEYESEIVRKITVRGTPYIEKYMVSKKYKDIRRKLVDHPVFSGQITIKVAPYSAQNPMSPVDLQFFIVLVPKSAWAKEVVDRENEMVLAIKTELQRIKERAEELERST
ncbi:hypothetical protein GSUET_05660 [Geobacter sulfurreducens subsp. ethanolicus]|uniref:Coenzyme Q-binding protein COQ10 START domain-containing protein n=1 Tax=Geomobilimonas luticola TaxID=1114878 RepID=A0ABS5SAY6_9BACT|nr:MULTISPECIES: hypothetical protein [Geobacteraceae]MBT0652539.1 hypothetical protein [Geomobilimonas luticola]BEH08954.1 hypothetical protein GSUET_05660 [Geobacter sulfurreducens subsp. ethanolicus]